MQPLQHTSCRMPRLDFPLHSRLFIYCLGFHIGQHIRICFGVTREHPREK